jgi:hypothetical protein
MGLAEMAKRGGDVTRREGGNSLTSASRVGLPATIGLVGIGLMVLADDASLLGAGIVLVGVAFLVALTNALVRLGIRSQRDRGREAWARRYLDRHGRWPQRNLRP